uniref:NADH-ubiquinone oxidoreductase chain 2 n=1 Tax=Provanna sp. JWQ-2014 TaxID=1582098 RepID=A0A0A7LUL7_9CAEN|nr:NADH dehydrogenase subunit 2 [Provanna sp. JWQ-2014]
MFSALPFSYMFFFMIIFGSLFSMSSCHWLGIWAGLEINLIGFLPLLVYQKSMSESESAVKYFVVQALGSSLLIFGSLSGYNLSFSWESLNFVENLSYLSLLIIGSSLIMKMGMFPFHFWFPSVMAGLPWLSCLLLTTWQKVAPLFLISSLFELNEMHWFFFMFCLASIGSSLIGGIGGLNQTQIRALLAYSSIGHLGWITFALIHSNWAMKVYLSIYILISFCIFMSLWHMNLGGIKNLNNLVFSNYFGFSMMIMLLSLGGLPPLLGFISKWNVIMASVSLSSWFFIFLLILGSLISLFYYLNLFFSLFFNWLKKSGLNTVGLKSENKLVVFSLLLNVLGGFVFVLGNLVLGM